MNSLKDPIEQGMVRLAVVGKRAVREQRQRFGMEAAPSAPYRSDDEQGLYVDQHFQEGEWREMPAAKPQPDRFRRPYASHVSRVEWWFVILAVSLLLGLAYSHLDGNNRHLADQWRAEDARMQAEADKP
jgi:hypothetical protein